VSGAFSAAAAATAAAALGKLRHNVRGSGAIAPWAFSGLLPDSLLVARLLNGATGAAALRNDNRRG